jgi:hypothetical protein
MSSFPDMALEQSYWSFVESHPAHRGASDRDQKEAMEFLAWCLAGTLTRHSTDARLTLPITSLDQLVKPEGDNGTTYPFSLHQCRELMDLLRSVESTW